ncbi:DUF1566 domain-containing protein [uncultured Shewanella sp.]|uniref:Lcl C-terminal domain-containing protein n=1 Tax=uncultured Shewanella sp. TaxID=173975 RepID=UPI00261C7B03|nr:DUF1566 domain-containing protein [uncultured Shewanella sp.]
MKKTLLVYATHVTDYAKVALILGALIGLNACDKAANVSSNVNQTQTHSTHPSLSYPIVDTNQVIFYDQAHEISAPTTTQAFYGQNAQFSRHPMHYSVSQDSLTVMDHVTGLTWTRTADLNDDGVINTLDKLSFTQAKAYAAHLNEIKYAGFDDWRVPTIKQLYSLMSFSGVDAAGPHETNAKPFIDTQYFGFAYGDESKGERAIDAQFWSSTEYTGQVFHGAHAAFGLNLADGRIKAYPIDAPHRVAKNFVYFVRGNAQYGQNQFTDNHDGTISDQATQLMWMKSDSQNGMNWQQALAWAQEKNAENFLGHNDWRLPTAKELQSIVDYQRSPDATQSAAINPIFSTTSITNEAGQADYPWFWSSTTHVNSKNAGAQGTYIAFGRAMGYMMGTWTDLHGAGAQRSDPKAGKLDDIAIKVGEGYHINGQAQHPSERQAKQVNAAKAASQTLADESLPRPAFNGHGPEDAIRINNYVRLVRSIEGS